MRLVHTCVHALLATTPHTHTHKHHQHRQTPTTPTSPYAAVALHTRATAATRAPPPLCKTTEFEFDKDDRAGRLTFGSSQKSITMVKPEPRGTLHEFVSTNAQQIVLSSWPRQSITDEGDGQFLIRMDAFDFLTIKVAVSMRARVRYDAQASVAHFESTDFTIDGLEGLAESIDVKVSGWMKPSPPTSSLSALTGNVRFRAVGDVPALLRSTPEPALRGATRIICESLIGAASKRFDELVPAAYREWGNEAP